MRCKFSVIHAVKHGERIIRLKKEERAKYRERHDLSMLRKIVSVSKSGEDTIRIKGSELDISKSLYLDISYSSEDITVIEPTRKLLRRAAEGV